MENQSMGDWKKCRLEDILIFGNGKVRPNQVGDIPVYGGNGILAYCDTYNYSDETLIIGRVGAYCGAVYYEDKDIWVSDNALSGKNKGGNYIKFLYYLLKDLNLNTFAEGSTHPLITQNLLKSIECKIPSFPEQKAIANILLSLDNKIGLLQRQNKTLEKMAENIFRQWFIESEGKNWEKKRMGDLITFLKGKKPNKIYSSFTEGLLPQILIETFDSGKTYFTEKKGMIISSKKDILMVMDGASSGRVEIGFSGVVGSTLSLLSLTNTFKFPLFIYLFLKNYENLIKSNTTGSAIPHVDKSLILGLEVRYPSINRVSLFSDLVTPMFDKLIKNSQQILTLRSLRKTLLPKLVSGEVRVMHN